MLHERSEAEGWSSFGRDIAQIHILVVEDDVALSRQLRAALQSLGYVQVRIAHDVSQAESLVTQSPPDIAILDWTLSSGTTSSVIGQRLNSLGRAIIYMSGFSHVDADLDAEDYTFLQKPFGVSDLNEALCNLIMQRAQLNPEIRCPRLLT